MPTPPPVKSLTSSRSKKLNLPAGLKAYLAIEGLLGIGVVMTVFITGVNLPQVAERQWSRFMLEGQEKTAFHYLCFKGRKDFCASDRAIGNF